MVKGYMSDVGHFWDNNDGDICGDFPANSDVKKSQNDDKFDVNNIRSKGD